jgi:predicted transcriptional regulator
MDSKDHELARKIKVRFGTATTEPSSTQIEKIKADIQALYAKGTVPSEKQWKEIVQKYCPDAGGYKYLYEGAEMPDLAEMLELAK